MTERLDFLTDEMYEQAKKLGISKVNVNNRYFNCDWSLEDSLTKPVTRRRTKYSQEILDLAKENGVSRDRFYQRVNSGMSEEEAATKKVLSKADAVRENQKKQWVIDPEHRKLAEMNDIPYMTFYKRVRHSHIDSYLAATIPVGEIDYKELEMIR